MQTKLVTQGDLHDTQLPKIVINSQWEYYFLAKLMETHFCVLVDVTTVHGIA